MIGRFGGNWEYLLATSLQTVFYKCSNLDHDPCDVEANASFFNFRWLQRGLWHMLRDFILFSTSLGNDQMCQQSDQWWKAYPIFRRSPNKSWSAVGETYLEEIWSGIAMYPTSQANGWHGINMGSSDLLFQIIRNPWNIRCFCYSITSWCRKRACGKQKEVSTRSFAGTARWSSL